MSRQQEIGCVYIAIYSFGRGGVVANVVGAWHVAQASTKMGAEVLRNQAVVPVVWDMPPFDRNRRFVLYKPLIYAQHKALSASPSSAEEPTPQKGCSS